MEFVFKPEDDKEKSSVGKNLPQETNGVSVSNTANAALESSHSRRAKSKSEKATPKIVDPRKRSENYMVRVNWLYRPKDISKKSNDTRLLFATMNSDLCPLASIRGKCTVMHKDHIEDPDEFYKLPDHFWFDKLFDRYIIRFFDVVPTEKIINIPEKVQKVLCERFKYAIVEVGRGKELCASPKNCEKCTQWCSPDDSVQCAHCMKYYHMLCVDPPLERKPSRGFGWSCALCSGARERKIQEQQGLSIQAAASSETSSVINDSPSSKPENDTNNQTPSSEQSVEAETTSAKADSNEELATPKPDSSTTTDITDKSKPKAKSPPIFDKNEPTVSLDDNSAYEFIKQSQAISHDNTPMTRFEQLAKAFHRNPTNEKITDEQRRQLKLWPFRYLGVHAKIEDVLDMDDRIYPRAASRLGYKHQASIPDWPGKPVIYYDIDKTERKYKKNKGRRFAPVTTAATNAAAAVAAKAILNDLKSSIENQSEPSPAALERIKELENDLKEIENGNKPPWYQQKPVGYVERGGDETSTLMWKLPENEDENHSIESFLEKAKPLAKTIGVPDYTPNFLDACLKAYIDCNQDEEKALAIISKLTRQTLKEPILTDEEKKRFAEGVRLYGSELHDVYMHVKTRPCADIVRYYYLWKKTPEGHEIWDNYEGRRRNKIKQLSRNKGGLVDDVADSGDDSAYDLEKSVRLKRTFKCKFCKTTTSKAWRRAPGQSVANETNPITALCLRCARIWRRYATAWEEPNDILRKLQQRGGQGWKRRMEPELVEDVRLILAEKEAEKERGKARRPKSSSESRSSSPKALELPTSTVTSGSSKRDKSNTSSKVVIKRETKSSSVSSSNKADVKPKLRSRKGSIKKESTPSSEESPDQPSSSSSSLSPTSSSADLNNEKVNEVDRSHSDSDSDEEINDADAEDEMPEDEKKSDDDDTEEPEEKDNDKIISGFRPINAKNDATAKSKRRKRQLKKPKEEEEEITKLMKKETNKEIKKVTRKYTRRVPKKEPTEEITQSPEVVVKEEVQPVPKKRRSRKRSSVSQEQEPVNESKSIEEPHPDVSQTPPPSTPPDESKAKVAIKPLSPPVDTRVSLITNPLLSAHNHKKVISVISTVNVITPPSQALIVNNSLTLIKKQLMTRPCSVCNMTYDPPRQAVCQNCGLNVHLKCYGLPDHFNFSSDWLCEACDNEMDPHFSTFYSCILCPVRIFNDLSDLSSKVCPDALKPTSDNNWAHVKCACWMPGLTFNSKELRPIDGIQNLRNNFRMVCKLCGCKKGACISCDHCGFDFHVGCGDKHGYFRGIKVIPATEPLLPGRPNPINENKVVKFNGEEVRMYPVMLCKHAPIGPEYHALSDIDSETSKPLFEIYIENYMICPTVETGAMKRALIYSKAIEAFENSSQTYTELNEYENNWNSTNRSKKVSAPNNTISKPSETARGKVSLNSLLSEPVDDLNRPVNSKSYPQNSHARNSYMTNGPIYPVMNPRNGVNNVNSGCSECGCPSSVMWWTRAELGYRTDPQKGKERLCHQCYWKLRDSYQIMSMTQNPIRYSPKNGTNSTDRFPTPVSSESTSSKWQPLSDTSRSSSSMTSRLPSLTDHTRNSAPKLPVPNFSKYQGSYSNANSYNRLPPISASPNFSNTSYNRNMNDRTYMDSSSGQYYYEGSNQGPSLPYYQSQKSSSVSHPPPRLSPHAPTLPNPNFTQSSSNPMASSQYSRAQPSHYSDKNTSLGNNWSSSYYHSSASSQTRDSQNSSYSNYSQTVPQNQRMPSSRSNLSTTPTSPISSRPHGLTSILNSDTSSSSKTLPPPTPSNLKNLHEGTSTHVMGIRPYDKINSLSSLPPPPATNINNSKKDDPNSLAGNTAASNSIPHSNYPLPKNDAYSSPKSDGKPSDNKSDTKKRMALYDILT